MLTNLIFLLLGNFTNSDRTPPYIDTYLQLLQTLRILKKTLSDKNEPTKEENYYTRGDGFFVISKHFGFIFIVFAVLLCRAVLSLSPYIRVQT